MSIEKIYKIVKAAVDAATSRKTKDRIGEEISEGIRTRTRSGQGVRKSEGDVTRLPKLKNTTVKRREGLKRAGRLSKDTSPETSNLTRSGKMLGSLRGRNTRKGVSIEMTPGQAKKAADLDSKFEFMNLSKNEKGQVVEIIEDEIQKSIKRG